MKPYPGCHTQAESNVGWHPFRLADATVLRTGPGVAFPGKRGLDVHSRVGRQSVRNPAAVPNPPMRGGRDGYVWVYALDGGDAGWVPERLLVPDPGGPASADFEVGTAPGVRHAPRPKRQPRFRLGRAKSGERVVDADEVYLRFAPHGTAFHYLLRGDRVRASWRHPRGYMCVEVLESRTVPKGTRGWVHDRVLRS
jgi:hypothetical protein